MCIIYTNVGSDSIAIYPNQVPASQTHQIWSRLHNSSILQLLFLSVPHFRSLHVGMRRGNRLKCVCIARDSRSKE